MRFQDDVLSGPFWPDYSVLPDWAQNIVDPEVPPYNIYTPLNLSDFMDRASGGDGNGNLGSFRLVGDVYYVTTDNDESFYASNHAQVHEHVLTKLDPQINYEDYDNWEFRVNGELYNHEYKPGVGDGIVDYIFIIWRDRNLNESVYGGIKDLYVNGLTLDGKTIYSSSGFGLTWIGGGDTFFDEYLKGAIIDSVTYGDLTLGITIKHGSAMVVPEEVVLYPNYPNPFNTSTVIRFKTPEQAYIVVTIFDVMGRQVRKLFSGKADIGLHHIVWDGKDDLGIGLGSGVYIYIVNTENFVNSKKMLLLR